ncbi:MULTISPECIES: VOC family protein [unclassified Bacillus (in: firmicutes)]|uniref:VOC family protein n=1 Tax=unclassified Bacillus (in: firmicutes) TaxID=185979 RepID=UPI001BE66790|nr:MULTISPECIES: VOC family protein [unclassified Bacillus (in: firmicutes)]MBT2639345.1 VOC family protein [Bacillus sp. ISL-39]MBT2661421.1 VOC family protein [Bacillus sp. ISL-45]
MELKMGYVILYVSDLEKTKQFYGELLGLKLRNEFGTYIEYETGNTVLSMNTRESGREITTLPIPDGVRKEQTFELGFVTEDVHGAVEKLRAAGVPILLEPTEKPWGQVVAYAADPDGHYIEICTPIG